ncbi:MAG: LysR family transcriptional regulator [Pseudomonadota bacterium]
MSDLNWDDFRFFLAVAREQRVSSAGKVLGVQHTTVARRIEALEKRLGTRLFDRSHSGYAMTQAAENLYEHALVMEEQMQAVDRGIIGMDAQLQGPLRLTAPYNLLIRLVIPHLYRLLEPYPGIALELMGTTGLLDLAAREADIALRFTASPPDYLIGKKILPLVHGIYGSESYFAENPKRHRFIAFSGDGEVPAWVEQHFPDASLSLRTDDADVMVEAIRRGYGLARLPCFACDHHEDLRRLDRELVPSSWGLWLLSHVDLRSTARVRVCREFLTEVILEQRAVIDGTNSRYIAG